MIKMCFFDRSNSSMTINALKQLLNGREREKLFTGIPQMGAFQKDMLLYFENVERYSPMQPRLMASLNCGGTRLTPGSSSDFFSPSSSSDDKQP